MQAAARVDNPAALQYTFYQVTQQGDKMNALQKIFKDILEPLYGSQEDALSKIALGKDRKCYLLYEQDHPVGVIAFKTVLSNEFVQLGVKESIEIKSLFVVDPENNSGKGLGSTLLNKVVEEADKLNVNHESLHVTVSETKGESLTFFKKKGFRIVHKWDGRYKQGVSEYLLSRSVKLLDSNANPIAAKTDVVFSQKIQNSNSPQDVQQAQKVFSASVLFIVKDAHWDDIHSIKLLSDGSFVTGSKDNSLCKWSQQGQLIRVVKDVDPVEIDSRDWITAIGILNDAYWISGERNGRVSLWTTEGDFVKILNQKRPKLGHVSLESNFSRVNCLATGLNAQKPSFFTGFPTIFDEYNLIEGRTTSLTKVHPNDWVYCIHPLTDKRILVVTGCNLETWDKVDKEWIRAKSLIREPATNYRQQKKQQRPFISSLTPLKASPHLFGLGIFGGDVKVMDIQQEKIVHQWSEHKKRVWTIENVTEQIFASCAEDSFIKFWDTRLQNSALTLVSSIGETHAMLSLNDNVLVAGSSRTATPASNEGAQLVFYDIRKN